MANATHVQNIPDIGTLNKATKIRVEEEIEEKRHEAVGGFKIGAAILGWLTATGVSTILTILVSSIGASIIVSQLQNGLSGVDLTRIGISAGILIAVISAAAYYAGGYVAGRLARFDGIQQGIGVWVTAVAVFLLVALTSTIFGAQYNVLQQMNLPSLPTGNLTATGIITLIASAAIALVAAVLGAMQGERYHRKVDRAGL